MMWGHYQFRHAQLTKNSAKADSLFSSAAQKFHRVVIKVRASKSEEESDFFLLFKISILLRTLEFQFQVYALVFCSVLFCFFFFPNPHLLTLSLPDFGLSRGARDIEGVQSVGPGAFLSRQDIGDVSQIAA
jgi:hypothetical protein